MAALGKRLKDLRRKRNEFTRNECGRAWFKATRGVDSPFNRIGCQEIATPITGSNPVIHCTNFNERETMKIFKYAKWILIPMPMITALIGFYAWMTFCFTGTTHWMAVETPERYFILLAGSVMMGFAFSLIVNDQGL